MESVWEFVQNAGFGFLAFYLLMAWLFLKKQWFVFAIAAPALFCILYIFFGLAAVGLIEVNMLQEPKEVELREQFHNTTNNWCGVGSAITALFGAYWCAFIKRIDTWGTWSHLPDEPESIWPEYKTCKRCKEADIKYWAEVCKHCGEDPDGPDGMKVRAELNKNYLEDMKQYEKSKEDRTKE